MGQQRDILVFIAIKKYRQVKKCKNQNVPFLYYQKWVADYETACSKTALVS